MIINNMLWCMTETVLTVSNIGTTVVFGFMLWVLAMASFFSSVDFRKRWKKARIGAMEKLLDVSVMVWKAKQSTIGRLYSWTTTLRGLPNLWKYYAEVRQRSSSQLTFWQSFHSIADMLHCHSWLSTPYLLSDLSPPLMLEPYGLATLMIKHTQTVHDYYLQVFSHTFMFAIYTAYLILMHATDKIKAVEIVETLRVDFAATLCCPLNLDEMDKVVFNEPGMQVRFFKLGQLPVCEEAYGVRYRLRSTGEIVPHSQVSLLAYLQSQPGKYLAEHGSTLNTAVRVFYYHHGSPAYEDIDLQLDRYWWEDGGRRQPCTEDTSEERWVSVRLLDATIRFDIGIPCLEVLYRLRSSSTNGQEISARPIDTSTPVFPPMVR